MTDNPAQRLFDALSDGWRRTRSDYHLTLGAALEQLAEIAPETPARFDTGHAPGEVDSYRGYYADLALEPRGNLDTVGKLHSELSKAIGHTFQGYKGGDFTMGPDTPLWRATYGSTGEAIIDLRVVDGSAVLVTKVISE